MLDNRAGLSKKIFRNAIKPAIAFPLAPVWELQSAELLTRARDLGDAVAFDSKCFAGRMVDAVKVNGLAHGWQFAEKIKGLFFVNRGAVVGVCVVLCRH